MADLSLFSRFGDHKVVTDMSNTIYVDSNGDDDHDGTTLSLQKKTVQAAYDAATFGTAINIGAGSYGDPLAIGATTNVAFTGALSSDIAPLTEFTAPVTVSGVTSELIRFKQIIFQSAVSVMSGLGRMYASGCAFNGGLTISDAVNWFTISDCALSDLTIEPDFRGVVYLVRCDLEFHTPSLSNPAFQQVVLADCVNVSDGYQNGINCVLLGNIGRQSGIHTFTSAIENDGSTRLGVADIANLPTGGVIGTAATTVDVKTIFNINQTTAGQLAVLPPPSDLSPGRVAQINNVGSESVKVRGVTIKPESGLMLVWNGAAWSTVGGGGAGGIIFFGGPDPRGIPGAATIWSENYDLTDPDPTLAGQNGFTYVNQEGSSWVYDGADYKPLGETYTTSLSPVYHNGTGWAAASAGDIDTVATAVELSTGKIIESGRVRYEGHGLVVGENYYLSQTGTGIQASPPGTGVVQGVLTPVDADYVVVDLDPARYADGGVDVTAFIPQRFDGSAWVDAIASDESTCAGAVKISATDDVRIQSGVIKAKGHGYPVGSGLYLSQDTPGGIVTTKPSPDNGAVQSLGYVADADTILADVRLLGFENRAATISNAANTNDAVPLLDGYWVFYHSLDSQCKIRNADGARTISGNASYRRDGVSQVFVHDVAFSGRIINQAWSTFLGDTALNALAGSQEWIRFTDDLGRVYVVHAIIEASRHLFSMTRLK